MLTLLRHPAFSSHPLVHLRLEVDSDEDAGGGEGSDWVQVAASALLLLSPSPPHHLQHQHCCCHRHHHHITWLLQVGGDGDALAGRKRKAVEKKSGAANKFAR
jgi:hypothetical protein